MISWSNKALRPRAADTALAVGLTLPAIVTGCTVLLVVLFVAAESADAFAAVGLTRFLTDGAWRPTAGDPQYSVLPMLAASAALTAGAMAIAAPAGLLVALCECYYAPAWLAALLRRMFELLAGVPSVVVGYWGLVSLVPLITRWEPPGQSLLAGVLVLALMIVPTVALTAAGALRAVPEVYWQSAAALGIGRAAVIWTIALPQARRGIAGGMILAAARAIGETMAILMVCGNVVRYPSGLFDPVRAVTANIALEMGYATAEHRAVLFATGALLVAAVGLAIAGMHAVGGRRK